MALAAAPAWAEPDAAALERLVRQDCGSCHGMTLKGGLGPDIRTGALGHHDHDSLAAVILDGIPGTPMPPWRPLLSEAEARWIATYLLTGGHR
ncbi:MAG: cytochrome c [Roseovarius sp.]|nr:cytochrome c [Roseovarius sp.]